MTNGTYVMLCVQFVGILWVLNFIATKTSFIYLVSCSQYYFSSNREKEGSARVMNGIMISYFKHAGSIALGSALHVIIMIIRIVVDSIIESAEKSNGNAVTAIVGCLLRCCIAWLEGIIEYLNRMAYSFMAISGDPYCTSAWNGFILNLKHMLKFYFASTLAAGFTFVGMLAIVGLNTGTFYLIVRYGTKNYNEVSSIWCPLSIIIIASVITGSMFLGLFDEAIAGTLMCLAVDLELNNGETKFGPPSFHEKLDSIFNKHGESATDPEVNINGKHIKGKAGKRVNDV